MLIVQKFKPVPGEPQLPDKWTKLEPDKQILVEDNKGISSDTLPGDTIPSLSFVPACPNLIAVVTLNGIVSFWNIESKTIHLNLSLDLPAMAVAFAPDSEGIQFALGSESGATRLITFDEEVECPK